MPLNNGHVRMICDDCPHRPIPCQVWPGGVDGLECHTSVTERWERLPVDPGEIGLDVMQAFC